MEPGREVRTVFLITGPSGSGKSTVARLLAERFPRGVHLEGDFFRRSIVSGRHEPTPRPSPWALEQLRLRYRLGATVAAAYFDEGFAVVLEDVVAGPLLSDWATLIGRSPTQVVVLLPTIEVVTAREASRKASGYTRWSIEELYDAFLDETPRIGLWLDTSEQTPEQTVEDILTRTIDR